MIIKRIHPISLARIAAVLYGGIGLIAGAIVFLATLAGAMSSGARLAGPGLGMAAIILLPIFYGTLGFIVTLIAAALFNVAARVAGGVEIDVD